MNLLPLIGATSGQPNFLTRVSQTPSRKAVSTQSPATVKMGKPFEKIHACIAGKIENAEKIPVWVRANGGAFYKTVTKKVTHLIVTQATYQENGEAGMLKIGLPPSSVAGTKNHLNQCKGPKKFDQSRLCLMTGLKILCFPGRSVPSRKSLTCGRTF